MRKIGSFFIVLALSLIFFQTSFAGNIVLTHQKAERVLYQFLKDYECPGKIQVVGMIKKGNELKVNFKSFNVKCTGGRLFDYTNQMCQAKFIYQRNTGYVLQRVRFGNKGKISGLPPRYVIN
jgi:hypothetical protein